MEPQIVYFGGPWNNKTKTTMDYAQVHCSHFISPTTCYSGVKRFSREGKGCLATETDIIRLEIRNEPMLTGYNLPRQASADSTCVGCDVLDEQQVYVLLQKKDDDTTNLEDSTVATDMGHSVSAMSRHRHSRSSVSMDSLSDATTTATTSEPLHSSLIVWKSGEAPSVSFSVPCRLLCPTLSRTSTKGDYLLWIGSADDYELRCFRIANGGSNTNQIQQVDLPEPMEGFTSPVMALASYMSPIDQQGSKSPDTLLAVGCQDGTVRLMRVSCRLKLPLNISLELFDSYTVIIDGPIMSLHFSEQRLLVGSMCGYVCQITRNKKDGSWNDPSLVVTEFLWDERHDADDAVLAVTSWKDNRVILGTYAGLIQILFPAGNKHIIEWSCQLPHTVHAIATYEEHMVVTTKQTLLVFESKQASSPYSAEIAKERLCEILETIKSAAPETEVTAESTEEKLPDPQPQDTTSLEVIS
jgi:hypothetical protein